jgi:hypothetical protein
MKPILYLLLFFFTATAASAQTVALPGGYAPGHAICFGGIGQSATCVSAAAPLPTTAQGFIGEATSRSGAITTGGTPQDLMAANASRHGWEIQNQSTANLYVRSKGAAGTTVATADQNSILIPPGGYYASPHVTLNALSIIGSATGQAFYAREW